ncbi:MAG: glyxoylase [Bryobacterales bacterium]|jgi:PhnB protein|nr:glyxoylase [Bryobacterales bacterium]
MSSNVKPIPDGYPALAPAISVRDADRAIDHYQKVFGAKERMRMSGPDGKIAHAELSFRDSVIMLGEENADNPGPLTLGGSPVKFNLYVEDVDAVAQRAVAAGGKIVIPIADQFYGDRSGRLQDPFGHLWIISTHKEDVPPEEMKRRMAAFSAKQG